MPLATEDERLQHEACLSFLFGILRTDIASADDDTDDNDAREMHWRDRLVAAWFIVQFVDERDLANPSIITQVWSTCATLIEEEVGQPLQRISLGLLGRLVSLTIVAGGGSTAVMETKGCPDLSPLRSMFASEKFCRAFGNALVYDHREDSTVGGGHSAQWSSGIQEILRDATSNLAPRTLFPFNRISQKSRTFKLQHSQLVESILLAIGHEDAKVTSRFLLDQAKELVAAGPSEDQRNQHVTSAEIFGGVARALIRYSTEEERDEVWETTLLPFLDDAILKMPTNLMSAFFDACRYAIHHMPPRYFYSLTTWCVGKVEGTLWQHEAAANDDLEESTVVTSAAMADRFAAQGKWLLLIQAVLAELDGEDDVGSACKLPWYCSSLSMEEMSIGQLNGDGDEGNDVVEQIELGRSWKHINDRLTPILLNAIGHPYDKCRDHIASCLFRMIYCHRKFINTFKATQNENTSEADDPRIEIMNKLISVRNSNEYSFKERIMALGTLRKFLSCCVHWGDARHEYPEFIIPLLPLAFQCLQTIEREEEVSPEDRGIETELIKGYRYLIADISSSCLVCYGVSYDMTRVLDVLKEMSTHEYWQMRQAVAHFMRCFQGAHKFLLTKDQDDLSLSIAISLLADDRREVSSAAMSTLTGILAVYSQRDLEELVTKYIKIANKSLKKKKRKSPPSAAAELSAEEMETKAAKEKERAKRQQTSVFVLCAIVLGRPYDTPPYIPKALAALSKHSFEQRASLSVREVVKMVCSEFKRTHTDNWEAHKAKFTTEELEALDDVVSTPHYYA